MILSRLCHIFILFLFPESSPWFYACYVTSPSFFSFQRVHLDFIPLKSHLCSHFWDFTMLLSLLCYISVSFLIPESSPCFYPCYVTSPSQFSFLRVHHDFISVTSSPLCSNSWEFLILSQLCQISIPVLIRVISPWFYPSYVTSQALFSFLRIHHAFIPVMSHLHLCSNFWEFTMCLFLLYHIPTFFYHSWECTTLLSSYVRSPFLFSFLRVHHAFSYVMSHLHFCSHSRVHLDFIPLMLHLHLCSHS